MRRPVLAVLAALALIVGGVGIVRAATTTVTASCTPSPVVTDTTTGQRITVVCTVPKPPAVTKTVTVTASPTASATPTATPTDSGTPTPSSTPSSTPTATPTSDPGTPTSSPTSSPTSTPTSTPLTGFPTRTSVGLPAGWTPKKTITGTYRISTPGTVVEDLQITDGFIIVDAENVTLRRVKAVDTQLVNEYTNVCRNGLLIENSEFVAAGPTSDRDKEVIGQGGYTFRNSVIDGVPEGLRVGATGIGCGPVVVENAFIRIVSPDSCTDWHGDGIQGYGGDKVTVRNTTILQVVRNSCYGTAPFFYPKNQGNTAVDVDGLLVGGSAGYMFRNGMPGPVKNLYVQDKSWVFGPVDVNCTALTAWDAHTATIDSAGQPHPVAPITCTGDGT